MPTSGPPATHEAPAAAAGDAYTAAQSAQDAGAAHTTRTLRVWRGEGGTGSFTEFSTEVVEGMVVLDAVHQIQADDHAQDDPPRLARRAGVLLLFGEVVPAMGAARRVLVDPPLAVRTGDRVIVMSGHCTPPAVHGSKSATAMLAPGSARGETIAPGRR